MSLVKYRNSRVTFRMDHFKPSKRIKISDSKTQPLHGWLFRVKPISGLLYMFILKLLYLLKFTLKVCYQCVESVFQQYWMWLLIFQVTFILFSKTYEAINKYGIFLATLPISLSLPGLFKVCWCSAARLDWENNQRFHILELKS